ncbi:hypothetical protein B0T10DRAFT_160336 [Thelonectria olida]|uniref:Putative lipoate-protein ligase A n=1 Tax=Thelonectria olida TaxID=1576542 RepID=A0A9P9AUD1_9HYPO|nr:hypothetical protein B0T10DRAFT_160336 [Thelonectria olida]
MALINRLIRPSRRLANLALPSSISTRRFTEAASHSSSKTQVYISASSDPFLNLSIEHHLLQNTHTDSTILILYTNSPCVVFGRNQNPWMEVNLHRLARIRDSPTSVGWTSGPVHLLRRRSGGGTVFHDSGNINFSVICPPAAFDRDKHANMVVRALSSLGRKNTRVNERHDIVMDVPDDPIGTYKISGSAYKLTRLRSLHHGTCLLRSPNLKNISGMLRSPAEAFVKTRGVDSVRSPVRNADVDKAAFEEAVVDEFGRMYGEFDVRETVDKDALNVPNIRKGYDELRSRNWIYGQTPRFTFSTTPYEDDPRERPALPFDHQLRFDARQGVLGEFAVDGQALETSTLKTVPFYDIADWPPHLAQAGMTENSADKVGKWMNQVLGAQFTRPGNENQT